MAYTINLPNNKEIMKKLFTLLLIVVTMSLNAQIYQGTKFAGVTPQTDLWSVYNIEYLVGVNKYRYFIDYEFYINCSEIDVKFVIDNSYGRYIDGADSEEVIWMIRADSENYYLTGEAKNDIGGLVYFIGMADLTADNVFVFTTNRGIESHTLIDIGKKFQQTIIDHKTRY